MVGNVLVILIAVLIFLFYREYIETVHECMLRDILINNQKLIKELNDAKAIVLHEMRRKNWVINNLNGETYD